MKKEKIIKLREQGFTIREIMKKIGLQSTFGELGIGEKDIEIIANTAFNSARMKNNPRTLTSDDIKKVLESLI